MTVRFDENLALGMVTLNCEKIMRMLERIVIHESLRHK